MREKKSEKEGISLGNYYKGLHAYEEAILAYKKVLELNPQNADAYFGLGSIYSTPDTKQGSKYVDREKGIECFSKAIEQDPHHIKAWVWLADTLRFKDPKGAIELLKKAIFYNPKAYSLYYRMGIILEGLDQNSEAIDYLHKSIELNPYYSWTWQLLSLVYEKLLLQVNAVICSIFDRTLKKAFTKHQHKYKEFLSNTNVPEFLQKLKDWKTRLIYHTTPEELTQFLSCQTLKRF